MQLSTVMVRLVFPGTVFLKLILVLLKPDTPDSYNNDRNLLPLKYLRPAHTF